MTEKRRQSKLKIFRLLSRFSRKFKKAGITPKEVKKETIGSRECR